MRYLVLGLLAVGVLAGCGQKEGETPGYTKEDFSKSAPPPEYRGPGQPGAPDGSGGPAGGPPAGAMSGPGGAAVPPPEVTGGTGQ